MNSKRFEDFKEAKELIEYINNRLDEGLTVKVIRDYLGVGEKKLQRYLKENNYMYDQKTKSYRLVTDVTTLDTNNITAPVTAVKTQSVSKSVSKPIVTNNLPVEFTDYDKLINMLNTYQEMSKRMEQLDKVEEMLQWYEIQKQQENIIDIEIHKLEIPPNDNELVGRTFKIYKDVYDEFMELCKKNSTYKVQDIVSYALREFIKKYNVN